MPFPPKLKHKAEVVELMLFLFFTFSGLAMAVFPSLIQYMGLFTASLTLTVFWGVWLMLKRLDKKGDP